jgi:hypothetical protein
LAKNLVGDPIASQPGASRLGLHTASPRTY